MQDLTKTATVDLLRDLEAVIDIAYPESEYYHANSALKAELNELVSRIKEKDDATD